jgi:hypothetical protein
VAIRLNANNQRRLLYCVIRNNQINAPVSSHILAKKTFTLLFSFPQVVWRSMQEKFIQQYKYFDELINRCYPGSMITLDFSIDSLLTFFSDIAQSH